MSGIKNLVKVLIKSINLKAAQGDLIMLYTL